MKIVRMQTPEGIRYGGVEPEGLRIYDGTPFVAWQPTEVVISFEQARLLAPVFPTKVVGVGANYALHAEEMGRRLPDSPQHLHQAVHRGDRTGPTDRASRPFERGSSRGRVGGGDRQGRPQGGGRGCLHRPPGLHRGQRRDRPRPAAGRRSPHQGQGLRHFLPARAGHRDRVRSARGFRPSNAG